MSTTPIVTSYTGRVKWFNNKTGYGFITITDGSRAGSDVFAHHSSIKVSSEQYRYLVQGEYVALNTVHTPDSSHEYQAGDVCGINGGKLMCETRFESKQTRTSYKQTSGGDESAEKQQQVSEIQQEMSKPTLVRNNSVRGSGPRDNTEWKMAKSGGSSDVKRPRGRPPKATISTDL